jgi:hypothetical protein
MDIPWGLILSLLWKLVGEPFFAPPQPAPITPPPQAAITAPIPPEPQIPFWVSRPPKACFVGISRPTGNLAQARQEALESATQQIQQSCGHGTTMPPQLSQWLHARVHQNLLNLEVQNWQGRYTCFALLRFDDSEQALLSRLARGPSLSARLVDRTPQSLIFKAREAYGVGVTLTSFSARLATANTHARMITLFVWKVPEGDERTWEGPLSRELSLKGNEDQAWLSLDQPPQTFLRDQVLGAKRQLTIELLGQDELGRPVRVPVALN